MSRLCPEDLTPLEPQTLHGLVLDTCPMCAGIYFDEGEIAALQAAGSEALTEVEDAVVPSDFSYIESPIPKRCPGCNGAMHAYRYRYSSEIRLDGCDRCGGIWVQDGELAKIADYVQSCPSTFGGTPAARQAAEVSNAQEKSAQRHAKLLKRVASIFG